MLTDVFEPCMACHGDGQFYDTRRGWYDCLECSGRGGEERPMTDEERITQLEDIVSDLLERVSGDD